MDRKIEFLVKGIVEGESNRFRVIGRCCEDAIQVGDSFDSIVYYSKDALGADGNELTRRASPSGLRLRVTGIHAYGQWLEVLGEGMTGTLDLEGTGSEFVSPGHLGGPLSIAGLGPTEPVPLARPELDAPHQEV